MVTKRLLNTLLILITVALAVSCKDFGGKLAKKNVTGKAGEVIVVADKGVWIGEPGIELRKVLASDYPALPQKEPAYNLVQIPVSAFSSLFQTHRNIIILQIDANEYTDPQIVTKEDVWAAPQTVINISAPSKEAAAKYIAEKKNLLFNTLGQAERNRIIRNSKRYEEKSLRELVAAEFGGSPYFPSGYSLKKKTNDFIWISYETIYTNQGIFIFRIPYKDTSSLTLGPLVEACDEVLKNNVPGMFENSYMITSKEFEPELTWMRYKGLDFAELRGLWEVENDFMGGPFVDHAFYSKDGKSIIVVEGFVYAPRYPKRNYLRQVESIIYSWEWAEDFNK